MQVLVRVLVRVLVLVRVQVLVPVLVLVLVRVVEWFLLVLVTVGSLVWQRALSRSCSGQC